MCGRYSLTIRKKEMLRRFEAADDGSVPDAPRFNLAPSQPAAVVAPAAAGGRVLTAVRWGLEAVFRTSEPARMIINARAETLMQKPFFRPLLDAGRCLVPADGFYEWQAPAGGRDRKQPWRFVLRDCAPFAFAGLRREGPGGPSFAILTTRPNALVAPVHDRMPVILRPEDEAAWLDPARPFRALPAGWLDPPDPAAMEAYAVSTAVNRAGYDGPECAEPARTNMGEWGTGELGLWDRSPDSPRASRPPSPVSPDPQRPSTPSPPLGDPDP